MRGRPLSASLPFTSSTSVAALARSPGPPVESKPWAIDTTPSRTSSAGCATARIAPAADSITITLPT